jgi:hypothetical protein
MCLPGHKSASLFGRDQDSWTNQVFTFWTEGRKLWVGGGLSGQKGVTERMFPQLEKSVGAKLEGTVGRQLQSQFQTIGRQALQVRSHGIFLWWSLGVNIGHEHGTLNRLSCGFTCQSRVGPHVNLTDDSLWWCDMVQEALRTCFESTVIPSFERSCRSMFEQVESSFQHGMAEYTSRAQQEFASSHSALASTLQVGFCSESCLFLLVFRTLYQ